MKSVSPALERLSDLVGIFPSYKDQSGGQVVTSDEARAALLAALGYDTASENSLAGEIERERISMQERPIAPVAVLPENSPERDVLRLSLSPREAQEMSDMRLEVTSEGGETARIEPRVRIRRGGAIRVRMPVHLGPGYHGISLAFDAAGRTISATQRRIVHPTTCPRVEERIDGRQYGIWTNLYTVRSQHNRGVGDLGDLGQIVRWSAENGAQFVGFNPLHSSRNHSGSVSPYSPLSRIYSNEVYINLDAVPEWDSVASSEHRADVERLRSANQIDYLRVAEHKLNMLRGLYQVFVERHVEQGTRRYDDYSTYCRQEGSALVRYATFRVLEDLFRRRGESTDWRDWPDKYRDPDSQSVTEFRSANRGEVDFHRYVQFELDRQLGAVAAGARSQMALGLYGDLAIGSDPSGAEVWANQDLFVTGATVGAPPDDFATEGQDWGLPPIAPKRLRESGYGHWIKLLRTSLRHVGALRLDHVMGLWRQYWIPRGFPGKDGAYLRYHASDLLGILALESSRSGTVIIGEDLGTVPPGMQSQLARWGILSSRVLYFEHDGRAAFRPSHTYSNRALVTCNTHDHVPIAGYWAARDLELRHRSGAYPESGSYDRALAERRTKREALLRRLTNDGLLERDRGCPTPESLARATSLFLAGTPSPLVGISLDDLAGETEPVNLPGLDDRHSPNWSRRMGRSIEDISRDSEVAGTLAAVATVRQGGAPASEAAAPS